MVSIEISAAYARVLFVAVLAAFQLTVNGVPVGVLRKKFFTSEFLKQHFSAEEAKKLSEGYPDMGQGRVSDKLPSDQWIAFGNAQRAHYNYLEGFPIFVLSLLVSGLFFADAAFVLGVVYVIGREMYSHGYRSKGARGRLLGVLLLDLVLLAMFGMSMYGAFIAGGGVQGFQQVFVGLAEQAQNFTKGLIAKYAA